MKKIVATLIVGLLAVTCECGVFAQELLIPPDSMSGESLTPDLALPPMSDPAAEVELAPGESYAPAMDSGEYIEGEVLEYSGDFNEVYHCDQAILESTGTWLRRGFWYAEVDAVISNRKWSRDSITLASQQVGVAIITLPNLAQTQVITENQLRVQGRKPGAEGAPRVTLGHFLFRDSKNRDHAVEFTAYGGGQWSEQATLVANPNNELGTDFLTVPDTVDEGNNSFGFAERANFRYDSRFNSFELNYLVKDRLGKDRMEMEPSGQWVRRAGPTLSRSFLAGVRFFDLTDDFLFGASGIDPDDDPNTADAGDDDIGSSTVRTDNDMIGTQLGLNHTYETARWSVGIETKGGLYLNMIDMSTAYSLTRNGTPEDDDISIESALEADQLSFVGEAALQGKWHLRPNFSLRAGFEFMFVTSQAVAPSQYPMPFYAGGPSRINSSGESTWIGGSIGFEGYW